MIFLTHGLRLKLLAASAARVLSGSFLLGLCLGLLHGLTTCHNCCNVCRKAGMTAQRIRNIHPARLVLPPKIKAPRLFIPSVESGAQALLRAEPGIGLVIRDHGEVHAFQMAPPLLEVVHHCEHLKLSG